jgi:Domain of unknown function (DUF4105)
MRRFGIRLWKLWLSGVITAMTVWGVGALYYNAPANEILRSVLAAAFGLGTLGAFVLLPRRRRTLVGFVLVWAALLAWWSTVRPSNERHWQPDVAVLPYATMEGDRMTLHNIRNFEYRTDTDFTPRYYDKTFDLKQLDEADLISSYWAGDAIAHVFVSFGFGGRDYVAISIETRKELAEEYSTIGGFFKQYELIYVVADERDVIRLRTTYRQPQEDVYLYRTRMPLANTRRLLMAYVQKINALVEHPMFYNTLTTNCTTNILSHVRSFGGPARYNWKILLSGYAAAYAYENGSLDTSRPFAELRQRSRVNTQAQAAHEAADFSQRIRVDLPRPPPRDALP